MMAELLVVLFVALEVAAAAMHLRKRRALAGWLLTAAGAAMCVGLAAELMRGVARIGLSTYQSDQRQLGFFLVALMTSLTAALRPRWRVLFWIAWLMNALVCAALVYLAFFWKVFQ
jgi:hypothetical protein